MENEAVWPLHKHLWVAVLHDHRFPYGSCGGGAPNPVGPARLVCSRISRPPQHSPALCWHHLLAFRGRRMAGPFSLLSTSLRIWGLLMAHDAILQQEDP